jgi:hypothetical protein
LCFIFKWFAWKVYFIVFQYEKKTPHSFLELALFSNHDSSQQCFFFNVERVFTCKPPEKSHGMRLSLTCYNIKKTIDRWSMKKSWVNRYECFTHTFLNFHCVLFFAKLYTRKRGTWKNRNEFHILVVSFEYSNWAVWYEILRFKYFNVSFFI